MGEATTTSPPRISELLLNSSQAQVEMGSRALPASMPPQPPHNIRIYHSIALTDVSLEEAYDKLARVDGMEAVVKLGAAAQRCDVEPVEYSTEYHDPADLQTPYNLDFTSPAMGAHLRRARFYLVEHLDYKIMAVDVSSTLLRMQTRSSSCRPSCSVRRRSLFNPTLPAAWSPRCTQRTSQARRYGCAKHGHCRGSQTEKDTASPRYAILPEEKPELTCCRWLRLCKLLALACCDR